jgi:hypothetical protein
MEISRSGIAAFVRCLDEAASAPGRLTHAVINSIRRDRERVAELYQRDGRTIARGLVAVADC